MSKLVLGYWRFRGYAQAIRLMLGYVNVEFVDKIYEMGDGPEFNRDDWLNKKFQLGIPCLKRCSRTFSTKLYMERSGTCRTVGVLDSIL